jgi:predicted acyltransferase
MASENNRGENYKACRLQFDFFSLVKLTTIVGLCFGVVSIPLVLLFGTGNVKDSGSWAVVVPFVVLLTPIVGAVNGALHGAIGYVLYQWLSKKTKGQTYTGIFVGLR